MVYGKRDYCAELAKKLQAEMEKYRELLLEQPSEVILAHAADYYLRKAVWDELRKNPLNARKARALDNADSPLRDICEEYARQETSFKADLWKAIDARILVEARRDWEKGVFGLFDL